jgi:hypothetical protein
MIIRKRRIIYTNFDRTERLNPYKKICVLVIKTFVFQPKNTKKPKIGLSMISQRENDKKNKPFIFKDLI